MKARRILIVGRGKFAIDCLKIIRRLAPECAISVLAEAEPTALGMTLLGFCTRENIECLAFEKLNTEANIARARTFGADLGLSLNNFQIIKPSLLHLPREGFVNFHNGPLPKYGGVNVCSWAILNGEPEYGVTWHFIDEGIDTGDIIAQRHFPIPDEATALSLTMRCFRTGVQMFEQLAPVIAHGSIPRQTQTNERRSYYAKRDVPYGGRIDFNWSPDEIDRFVRGLSFQPMPNPFVYPKCNYANLTFYVLSVEIDRRTDVATTTPGTIVDISKNGISVSCGQGLIILRELLDAELNKLSLDQFVRDFNISIGKIIR